MSALRGKVIRSYQHEPQLDEDDAYDTGVDPSVEDVATVGTAGSSDGGASESAPSDEFASVLSEAQDVPAATAQDTSSDNGEPAPTKEPDPEEDNEASAEEKLMAEFRRQTGQSQEQAVAWLRQYKAAAAARQQPANTNESEPGETEEEKRRRAMQMQPGRGSAIGSLFGGIGGAVGAAGSGLRNTVGSTIRAGRVARDAAKRATGINRGAGVTPAMVRERMFSQWHHEYESGVRKMDDSMEALVKAAAAYNQVVRMSAPGRELEKIAKSRGQDLQTLMSEITAGKIDDTLTKDHMEAIRTDPNVRKAWAGVDRHNRAFEDGLGMMKTGMRKIDENFADRVDMGIEAARVSEILERNSDVEKPLQVPANPIGDQKANGKSAQKSMWEQFQEMTQGGLSFLRDLVEKFSNFVAAKFGAR
jgi:hypothetical protein